jgi:hypothetical protein
MCPRAGTGLLTAQYREALTRRLGWQIMPLDGDRSGAAGDGAVLGQSVTCLTRFGVDPPLRVLYYEP